MFNKCQVWFTPALLMVFCTVWPGVCVLTRGRLRKQKPNSLGYYGSTVELCLCLQGRLWDTMWNNFGNFIYYTNTQWSKIVIGYRLTIACNSSLNCSLALSCHSFIWLSLFALGFRFHKEVKVCTSSPEWWYWCAGLLPTHLETVQREENNPQVFLLGLFCVVVVSHT